MERRKGCRIGWVEKRGWGREGGEEGRKER